MKFFIDTANLDEIREAEAWGILAGVTTNPSLYAKTGGKLADFENHMAKICEICKDIPGRFEDCGEDGIEQLETVVTCVKNYEYGYWEQEGGPEIITASVRTPHHVTQAALMGADIATVPFAALKKCVHHPLTDKGLASFAADWEKVVNA